MGQDDDGGQTKVGTRRRAGADHVVGNVELLGLFWRQAADMQLADLHLSFLRLFLPVRIPGAGQELLDRQAGPVEELLDFPPRKEAHRLGLERARRSVCPIPMKKGTHRRVVADAGEACNQPAFTR